jgi:hypothetical protein
MSYGIVDLIANQQDRPQIFEGIFAENAATVDSMLEIIIPSFDLNQRWGPCPWTPRPTDGGIDLPSRGDRCLVALDDNGNPWVIGWWPYG